MGIGECLVAVLIVIGGLIGGVIALFDTSNPQHQVAVVAFLILLVSAPLFWAYVSLRDNGLKSLLGLALGVAAFAEAFMLAGLMSPGTYN